MVDKKKEILMNTYKKTIMALGIALIAIPQAFASVPNMEEIARRQFDEAYQNIFASPFDPFKQAKDFNAWNNNLGYLTDEVKKNGGNDSILVETMTYLPGINANFINGMKTGYALYAKNPNPSALEKSKVMIIFTNNIQKLGPVMDKLNKEPYYLPGKKKAKAILVFIFEKLLRANETAANALSR